MKKLVVRENEAKDEEVLIKGTEQEILTYLKNNAKSLTEWLTEPPCDDDDRQNYKRFAKSVKEANKSGLLSWVEFDAVNYTWFYLKVIDDE